MLKIYHPPNDVTYIISVTQIGTSLHLMVLRRSTGTLTPLVSPHIVNTPIAPNILNIVITNSGSLFIIRTRIIPDIFLVKLFFRSSENNNNCICVWSESYEKYLKIIIFEVAYEVSLIKMYLKTILTELTNSANKFIF